MMLKPGQREPTEREKMATRPDKHTIPWWGPTSSDLSYQPVGLFVPRSVSDFLWERDEEAYPNVLPRWFRKKRVGR